MVQVAIGRKYRKTRNHVNSGLGYSGGAGIRPFGDLRRGSASPPKGGGGRAWWPASRYGHSHHADSLRRLHHHHTGRPVACRHREPGVALTGPPQKGPRRGGACVQFAIRGVIHDPGTASGPSGRAAQRRSASKRPGSTVTSLPSIGPGVRCTSGAASRDSVWAGNRCGPVLSRAAFDRRCRILSAPPR